MSCAILRSVLPVIVVCVLVPPAPAADPLPSWNDTPTKKAITDFVAKVTKDGSPDFVPVAERIAVFDNDGTLWCEQPVYSQVLFAIDRVKATADKHPEWKDKPAFSACSSTTPTASGRWPTTATRTSAP